MALSERRGGALVDDADDLVLLAGDVLGGRHKDVECLSVGFRESGSFCHVPGIASRL